MPASIDLSACLVRSPQTTLVLEFLESLHSSADPIALEAIIIDPFSDATTTTINQRYNQTIIFETQHRENVPTALNRALTLAKGRYIMLASEALLVNRQSLLSLLTYLDDNPRVGIIAPSLVDAKNTILANAWSYPSLARLILGHSAPGPPIRVKTSGNYFAPALPVNWISTDCLIIRRETLEEVQSLDAAYQHRYYDLDICWRARRHGWHIVRMPSCPMCLNGKSIYATTQNYPADLSRFLAKRARLLPFFRVGKP